MAPALTLGMHLLYRSFLYQRVLIVVNSFTAPSRSWTLAEFSYQVIDSEGAVSPVATIDLGVLAFGPTPPTSGASAVQNNGEGSALGTSAKQGLVAGAAALLIVILAIVGAVMFHRYRVSAPCV